jgi:hypothetical protein
MDRDVFDQMSEREPEPMREEDRGRCLVVGVRAKDSAEIEAREAAYFGPNPSLGTGAWWPVPFFDDVDDEFPAKLSKAEVACLADHYGITEEEYRELVRREIRK